MTFQESCEFIQNNKLDYGSLVKTEAYKRFMAEFSLNVSFNQAVVGFEIDLIGDLSSIMLQGTDCMKLSVMYSLHGCEPVYARVLVTDEKLKREIRLNAKTNRGVKLHVKAEPSGVDTFELINIIELDDVCNFGQYICQKCGHNYMFDSDSEGGCCICGGEVKQVFDFYNKEV